MAKWSDAKLDAALSPTPSPVTVKVKPLEWAEFGRECLRAPSLVGRYEISWGFEAGFVYLDYSGQLSKKQSIEAAKAAAQADYEARILSALEATPSPEAIVRAAWGRAADLMLDGRAYAVEEHGERSLIVADMDARHETIRALADNRDEINAILLKAAGEDRG
jgi:pantoate kinase